MKKSTKGVLAIGLSLPFLVTTLISLCYATSLSYIYCILREDSLTSSETVEQLENRLIAFYSKSEIEPKDSDWGFDYQLKEGEKMTRFLIFEKEPLDVVHDGNGVISQTFTSYE